MGFGCRTITALHEHVCCMIGYIRGQYVNVRRCWFRYVIKDPPDGQWGTELRNGKWSGMVGMMQNKVRNVVLLSKIAISNESILPPFSLYSISAEPNMSQLMYTRKLTVISGLFNQGGQSTTNYRVATFLSSMAEKIAD